MAKSPSVMEAPATSGESELDEPCRPMRADARRNYELLVTTAREVFATEGGGASLEAIARKACVGVGTLYRHFPTRIDLVEAVYRTDVDNLIAVADRARNEFGPWDAVVEFLQAFVTYAQGKRTFLNELHEAFEKNPELRPHMLERIRVAIEAIIGRAQDAGVVRLDVSGSDVMQLVGPMCTNATLSEDQSRRLLGMILDGLRQRD